MTLQETFVDVSVFRTLHWCNGIGGHQNVSHSGVVFTVGAVVVGIIPDKMECHVVVARFGGDKLYRMLGKVK